jgi:hypothetical protein
MNAGNDGESGTASMETVPMLEQMPVDSVPPPSE